MPIILMGNKFNKNTKEGGSLKLTDDETIYKAKPSGQIGTSHVGMDRMLNATQSTKAPTAIVNYGGSLMSNIAFRNRDKKAKTFKLQM